MGQKANKVLNKFLSLKDSSIFLTIFIAACPAMFTVGALATYNAVMYHTTNQNGADINSLKLNISDLKAQIILNNEEAKARDSIEDAKINNLTEMVFGMQNQMISRGE